MEGANPHRVILVNNVRDFQEFLPGSFIRYFCDFHPVYLFNTINSDLPGFFNNASLSGKNTLIL